MWSCVCVLLLFGAPAIAGSTIGLSASSVSVLHNSSTVSVAIQRTGSLDSAASVHFSTKAGTAQSSVSGTPYLQLVKDSMFNTSFSVDAASFSFSGREFIAIANSGAVEVYVGDGASSWKPIQSIPGKTVSAVDVMNFEGQVYLSIANSLDADIPSVLVNSEIYTFDSNTMQFSLFQSFQTSNCTAVKFFLVNSGPMLQVSLGVAFANFNFVSPDYQTTQGNSRVFILDVANQEFALLQEIVTNGATAIVTFSVNGNFFLAFSEQMFQQVNWLTDVFPQPVNYSVPSKVYVWNGLRFSYAGNFPTYGAVDIVAATIDSSTNLVLVANADNVAVFQVFWNSINQQFLQIPVQVLNLPHTNSLTVVTVNSTVYVFVASAVKSTALQYFRGEAPSFDVASQFSLQVVAQTFVSIPLSSLFIIALQYQDSSLSSQEYVVSTLWTVFQTDDQTIFGSKSGTVYFYPGESVKSVTIPLFTSSMFPSEYFTFSLSSPSPSSSLTIPYQSKIVIQGNFPLNLQLLDLNNNPVDAIDVQEGNDPYEQIATVTVTNPVGASAAFSFSIQVGDTSMFAVATDGSIYALQTLQKNTNPAVSTQYVLLVSYSSSSDQVNVGKVWVVINVVSVMGSLVQFMGNSNGGLDYQVTIPELQPVGSMVVALQLAASIGDQTYLFGISAIDPPTIDGVPPFTVNSISGIISTNAVISKGNVSRPFTISCTATNPLKPSQISFTTVIVTILAVDNIPPTWSTNAVAVSVPRNLALLSSVVSGISASITNPQIYGAVWYSLIKGNQEKFFRLDSSASTLNIVLIKKFDYINGTRFFNLTLSACTTVLSSSQNLCSSLVVTIQVSNVNLYTPTITATQLGPAVESQAGRLYIMSDEPVGTPLVSLTWMDQDFEEAGMVSFALLSNPKFALMDPQVSVITVKNSMIFGPFQIVLTAADGGTPAKSYTYVTQAIAFDRPVFPVSSASVNIPELSVGGTFVAQMSATVNITTDWTNLQYSLLSGNELGKFWIDPNTLRFWLLMGQFFIFSPVIPCTIWWFWCRIHLHT